MSGERIDVTRHTDELARWDLVKCPRMTEVLPSALAACGDARAVVLVRDPRDVLCSIQEKVRAGMPTRMLEFSRLGIRSRDAAGFARAYRIYAATVADALNGPAAERVRLVVYESFCYDKSAVVAELAAWIGWPYDAAVLASRQHEQLGPAHTKRVDEQSIKGPRRWANDLDESDRAALEPALRAYATLRARA
jgi:hypothetical protein